MNYLSIGEWGGTPNGWPAMKLPAVALWVHHSVTARTGDPVADFRTLDGIGRARGHGGISYSFAIEGGTVGEGQGTRRGAHTAGKGCNNSPWGWNPCSFGVVFVGNFDNDSLTPEDIHSFHELRDKLINEGLLVPDVYPTGGHRDAPGNATGCPGANVMASLDLLRQPLAPLEEDDMRDYYTVTGALNYSHVPGVGMVPAQNATNADGTPAKFTQTWISQADFDRMNATTGSLTGSVSGSLTVS